MSLLLNPLVQDFLQFVARSNILQLATGLALGSTVARLVQSFVAEVFTPLVSFGTGQLDLSERFLVLRGPAAAYPTVAAARAAGALTLNYGAFGDVLLEFAAVVFFVFFVNRAVAGEEERRVRAGGR